MAPRTESRAGPTRSTRSTRWAYRTSTVCSPISSASGWTRNGSAPACCRSPPNHIRSTGCATPRTAGEGRLLDTAAGARGGELADLPGGPVTARTRARIVHPAKLALRTGPRVHGRRRADLRAHQRHRAGHRRVAPCGWTPPRRRSRRARRCWRRTSIRACCDATACTPCRCTTTCWPPSLSPMGSWTASAGGTGRESGTARTSFTTTG